MVSPGETAGYGGELTGQVPPPIILSKDSASGMPWFIEELFDDAMDSWIDACFSSPVMELESRGDWTNDGRRYDSL